MHGAIGDAVVSHLVIVHGDLLSRVVEREIDAHEANGNLDKERYRSGDHHSDEDQKECLVLTGSPNQYVVENIASIHVRTCRKRTRNGGRRLFKIDHAH